LNRICSSSSILPHVRRRRPAPSRTAAAFLFHAAGGSSVPRLAGGMDFRDRRAAHRSKYGVGERRGQRARGQRRSGTGEGARRSGDPSIDGGRSRSAHGAILARRFEVIKEPLEPLFLLLLAREPPSCSCLRFLPSHPNTSTSPLPLLLRSTSLRDALLPTRRIDYPVLHLLISSVPSALDIY
jgi:hypothetical protein